MIACAKWLGRTADTCTRGEVCVCKDKPRTQRDIFVLEGQYARADGKPESSCPYKNRPARKAWIAGWSYSETVGENNGKRN